MISKSKDISLSPNFNANLYAASFWAVVRSTIIKELIIMSRYLPNVAGVLFNCLLE